MNSQIGIGMTSTRTRDRLVERLRNKGIRDPRVLQAIGSVPRYLFVDEALSSRAYEDSALPIGHGQTISQPYVVARITAAAIAGERPHKVLEIGSGCGYQAAVLAVLVPNVYGVERIRPLLARSRKRFLELGIHNVSLHHGDGYEGWADHAPYDAIVVSAAIEAVPEALFAQLGDRGRLIAPVGPPGGQRLILFRKTPEGIEEERLDAVIFVGFRRGTVER